MQGPEYIFFLKDLDTGLYYRVDNGNVMTGAPTPLQYSPSGWKTLAISNKRNSTYFALDRSFTSALDFVEDGGKILKHIFYYFGFEKNIQFIVARQKLFIDNTQYGFQYEPFYQGEVDLSTFVHDGPKVTVNIMEGGALKYIKAFQNQKYEIDVDVPEAVKIKMDGLKLSVTETWAILGGNMHGDANHTIAAFNVQVDGPTPGVQLGQSPLQDLVGFDLATNDDRWIQKSIDLAFTAEITGKISFDTHASGGATHYSAYIQKNTGAVYYLVPDTHVGQGVHNFNFSVTIPMNPDDKMFIFGNISDGLNEDMTYYQTDFTIKYKFKYKTTFVKGLPPLYVYNKLLEKMTDGKYSGASTLLASNANFVVTCGDAIRGIAGAKVKTSLADFFASFNTQFDIGMGMLSGVLTLEKKASFVDYTNPIFLGEASNMKPKVAADYCFSGVKIGYPEQNYDAALGAVNGKYEFNNSYSYTTAITRKSKQLDLSSIYRTDSLGIEFTRINLDGKITTDDSSDNDVFLIHTEKVAIIDDVEGAVYRLNRDLNPYLSGVIDPASVFNAFLSPGQCLLRNGQFIHSCFYQMDNTKLAFQTTEKNHDLTFTIPPAGIVHDAADVLVGSLAAPLFRPVSFEIDVPAPVDLFEILDANPVKAFSWTYEGVLYTGLPVDASCEPYTGDKQTYTMLSAPFNDLTPLIDVYE